MGACRCRAEFELLGSDEKSLMLITGGDATTRARAVVRRLPACLLARPSGLLWPTGLPTHELGCDPCTLRCLTTSRRHGAKRTRLTSWRSRRSSSRPLQSARIGAGLQAGPPCQESGTPFTMAAGSRLLVQEISEPHKEACQGPGEAACTPGQEAPRGRHCASHPSLLSAVDMTPTPGMDRYCDSAHRHRAVPSAVEF